MIKNKEIDNSWLFLGGMIIVYIVVAFLKFDLAQNSLIYFGGLFLSILPVFVLIFILMFLTNYFVTNEFIIKHFQSKGIKKWIYTILGGVLSSGPIYMWYPLLAQARSKGISNGLVACFLYNRAIKLPLLPIMLLYFDWQYILILFIMMVLASVGQGLIINKMTKI